MLSPQRFKLSATQTAQFYRCPGCNHMVDGGQLSEILVHHQHVLDSYRLRVMQRLGAARETGARTSAKRYLH